METAQLTKKQLIEEKIRQAEEREERSKIHPNDLFTPLKI